MLYFERRLPREQVQICRAVWRHSVFAASAHNEDTLARGICSSLHRGVMQERCELQPHLSEVNMANCEPSRLSSIVLAIAFAFAQAYKSVSSVDLNATSSAGKS